MKTKPQLMYEARVLAKLLHGNQVRRYTNEPYFTHLQEVNEFLDFAEDVTVAMRQAAILHDTIEDTVADRDLIIKYFGCHVANMVWDLTDQCFGNNRYHRKTNEANRLALIPPYTQTIKLADVISNTKSIVEHDPGFAKVYLPEMDYLLKVMKEGDPTLYKMARRLVDDGFEKIGN